MENIRVSDHAHLHLGRLDQGSCRHILEWLDEKTYFYSKLPLLSGYKVCLKDRFLFSGSHVWVYIKEKWPYERFSQAGIEN